MRVFNRRPLIYVAGPLRAKRLPWPLSYLEVFWNTWRAAVAGTLLMRRGWSVVIPHTMTALSPTVSKLWHLRLAWVHYLEVDLEIVRRCDALLFLGSSPGADLELKEALAEGKTIYYSLKDIPHGASYLRSKGK